MHTMISDPKEADRPHRVQGEPQAGGQQELSQGRSGQQAAELARIVQQVAHVTPGRCEPRLQAGGGQPPDLGHVEGDPADKTSGHDRVEDKLEHLGPGPGRSAWMWRPDGESTRSDDACQRGLWVSWGLLVPSGTSSLARSALRAATLASTSAT